MPDKNTQFSKNQRFYKLYEEFYLTLMQNKSEFEITQAGSTPEFKILSAATLPSEPISPNKPIIYGIGFVAGLSFCVFFLALAYVMNNKVTSLSELEQVSGVPALGVIPALKSTSSNDLHLIDQPKSMVSESFRSLRTNLDFFSANSDKKVIVVSSTVSGEGKSFVAENLGAALAQSNKKVVLIDLDMRKTHKVNISKQPKDQSNGISKILINRVAWKDCVINTTQEHFDFIPAGTQPPNPSELLLNGSFSAFIDELKSQYDFVILDTPPVGLVADGITAMKKADISIYVFRANYSKKDFLHSLRRTVNLNKLSNVTTVLNGMPVPYDSYGYGYYQDRPQSGLLKSLFKKRA
jgi:capsular exopolysaccharide synthesis family protein